MSEEININLKSFPIIKLTSSILFIIGAILAYVLSSKPEFLLFQIGGIPLNLVFGIPPLLSGIVLLLYSLVTYYNVQIRYVGDKLILKSRKNEAEFEKDDLKVVRVRDAGKFYIYFVFVFVNFYFVYYGIECSLYFSANHNAGLLEFVLIPMFMIWFANVLLIIFQRKLVIFGGNEKAIIQKINHLPKDGSFSKLMDVIFQYPEDLKDEKTNKSDQYLYRLILGIIVLSVFILTSILVDIDGIIQPLHDIGIFVPIFILLFGVMLISSSLKEGKNQSIAIRNNTLRIKESTILTPINGKNYIWMRSKGPLEMDKLTQLGFRKLTAYQYMVISVIFGEAFYLAFKFIWIPSVFLSYISIIDVLIGIILLAILFFFQFEIRNKAQVELDSEFKFKKEIFTIANAEEQRKFNLKFKVSKYIKEFKSLLKTDFKKQILWIGLAYVVAIVLITLSISFMNFIIFWYI